MSRTSLDDFISPISKSLGRTEAPAEVDALDYASDYPRRSTDGLSGDALTDRFTEEAEKVRVQVSRCGKDDLAATVCRIISKMGEGSVIYADDGLFSACDLGGALEKAPQVTEARRWDASAGRDANVEFCKGARYGITHASFGIAETGTVVQENGVRCGRSVSLLPLVHIAVVDAGSIKPSMREVLLAYDEASGGDGSGLPSQICMITGPSMTSDIELVRVDGVHGPMYVCYIIVD